MAEILHNNNNDNINNNNNNNVGIYIALSPKLIVFPSSPGCLKAESLSSL